MIRKYRGKTWDGKWVYGLPVYLIQENYDNNDIDGISTSFDINEDVNPETVGQFTGILDDNNVEIYEGDIIEDVIGKFKTQVYFYKGRFVAGPSKMIISDSPSTSRRKVVVGNIYDNPELMDGDKVKY